MPVDHAALRAAKLAAHQSALPPEQQIVNRTDFDKFVSKKASVLTRENRDAARKAFIATVSDPYVGICNTPEEAEAYFQPGDARRPFTCTLLRKFLEASAISRTGRIEDNLSSRSLEALMINLFGAAKQAGNPVERQVKRETLLWLYSSMLDQGLVHRKARDKHTPIPEDITSFLKYLFDRRFISTVHTTRDVLLIALFVCLQIDCSARVSDLLTPCMTEENYVKYKIEHKNKFFTWDCVEVFAFKEQGGSSSATTATTSGASSVYLQARVTFKSIKDTHNTGYKVKTIPLRLLPPTHVAEDTLFWLMVLGLIDGVFEGVSSWDDIDRLQPGPNGLRIPIRYGWKDTSVFRHATRNPSSKGDLISKEQMRSYVMLGYLHSLSRFCGLEHAMLPNVFRRGSAQMLSVTVTKEERCARMGHVDTDPTYWSSYRNTTSTVDFQALRHGMEQERVSMMSSVFLDTGNSGDQNQPPDRVSAEGMAKIRRDARLIDLLTKQSAISDELLENYGSFDKARALDPERYADYMDVRKQYSTRESHLVEREYKIEYKAYWEARKHPGTDGSKQQQESTSTEAPPDLADQLDQIDHLLDELDQEPTDSHDSTDPIDSQAEADSAEALSALVSSLDEGEAAGDFLDGVQGDAGDSGGQQEPDASSSPSSRSFSPRQTARHSVVDELAAHLYGLPSEDTTWNSLSAYCVSVFNHLHESDRFYPCQEPLPGTWSCRFCGYHLAEIKEEKIGGEFPSKRPHIHTYICEGERLAQDVLEKLEARGEAATWTACPLPKLDKTGGTALVTCSSQLEKYSDFWKHVNGQHHDHAGPHCLAHGAPLFFSNWPDFRMHVVVAHSMPASILKYKRLNGNFDVKELVFFCPFCQVWIPRSSELEEDHLATHFDDAIEVITTLGFAGMWRLARWAHPAFCPFCLYDTTLSAATRFHQFPEPRFLLSHISTHLEEQEDPTRMLCPATALTPEGLPQCPNLAFFNSPPEMADHLREAHDLDVEAPTTSRESDGVQTEKGSKRRRKATKTDRKPLQEKDTNLQVVSEQGGKQK